MLKNQQTRLKRKMHIRQRVRGTAERPRLTVFRSNRYVYAQIIDDSLNKTLVSLNDAKITTKANPTAKATQVGEELAKLASKVGITRVVFDRNGYKFHGRVKALADGARKGGLEF